MRFLFITCALSLSLSPRARIDEGKRELKVKKLNMFRV